MNHGHGNRMTTRARWVFVAFIVIAAYFVITEHRAHLSGLLYYWPFVLLLACPVLHMFMHGGHGRYGRDDAHRDRRDMNERGRS